MRDFPRLTPLVLAVSAAVGPQVAWAQGDQTKADSQPGEQQILALAEQFVSAFNAHQIDTLVELYAENAEVMHRDGTRLSGREQIRESFEEFFASSPEATLGVRMESLRLLTPELALEEGTATIFENGSDASYVSRYVMIHAHRNGEWKIAASKTTEEADLSSESELDQLDWMLGEWMDEGESTSIKWSCKRTDDGKYLVRSYDVVLDDGRAMSGVQRIGWDPVRERIRSWAFDSEGGFVEATWSRVGDVWINKASGYLADGTIVSSTNHVIPIREDRYLLRSIERLAGDESVDDVEAVVVRRGPTPRLAAE